MKHKEKNTMSQAEHKTLIKNSQPSKNPSWEMSAQDALRVDYVTRNRILPY
tara:strand:+ start:13533 stop:13685 length:153 start_codon:yes stop_codon:yes gene_type:complete